MSNVISWLAANWQSIVVAILAIDAALIPIFPKVGILASIKTALTPLAPKS